MAETITVTISGPTGSGKSALYIELYVALKALGLTVKHANPAEWLGESGLLSSDGNNIHDFNPSVLIREVNQPREAGRSILSGVDHGGL